MTLLRRINEYTNRDTASETKRNVQRQTDRDGERRTDRDGDCKYKETERV